MLYYIIYIAPIFEILWCKQIHVINILDTITILVLSPQTVVNQTEHFLLQACPLILLCSNLTSFLKLYLSYKNTAIVRLG